MESLKKLEIALMGSPGVGKSSILRKYINANININYAVPTIGVDIIKKKCVLDNNTTVDVTFWDSSGDTNVMNSMPFYFKRANIFFLVFDVSNVISFFDLSKWMDVINKYNDNYDIILVANKSDKGFECDINEHIINFINIHNVAKYYEMSALTGKNINNAIEEIIKWFFYTKINFVSTKFIFPDTIIQNKNPETIIVFDESASQNKGNGKKLCCF